MINYRELNKVEKFFVDSLTEKLELRAAYNMMPNATCFSYCVNEINKIFRLYINTSKRINHFYLCEDFYRFLQKDKILKSIDEAHYFVMLKNLKELLGGSANIIDVKNYFSISKNVYSNKYFDTVFNRLIDTLRTNNDEDLEEFENLIQTFINELLYQRCSYKFLCDIFHSLKKGNIFKDIYDFLYYITEKAYNEHDKLHENIEMYLPIKNAEFRDIEFIKTKQNIEIIDEQYYCKIYSNCIDFYNLCELNMRRIESIFNIFRFNRETNVDFDYSKHVIVRRQKLQDEFKIDFKQLVSYKYFIGKKTIIEQTLRSLEILNTNDNPLYYKFNNILNYAEKDNDFLTVSSFVDNWIALESLIQLSESHLGYDGVRLFVPKLLAIKYFRQEINLTLKYSYGYSQKTPSLQKFIDDCVKNQKFSIIDNCKSDFYKFKLKKYVEILSDFNCFTQHISEIKKSLEFDIARIYLVRNEYVHSSNLSTFNNLQKYKLKRILADCIDVFTKALNANIKVDRINISGEDIFSDIMKKSLAYDVTLEILSGKYKLGENKVGRKTLESSLTQHQILENILFERVSILNPNKHNDN